MKESAPRHCRCPILIGLLLAVHIQAHAATVDVSTAAPEFLVFGASVTAADIVQDQISVSLSPAEASGEMALSLTGPSATHLIRREVRAGGMHQQTFNIPNLAAGEFTEARVEWVVGQGTATSSFGHHIRVLGDYRHSQYNLPEEVRCTGTSTNVYTTNAQCTFTGTQFRSQFVSQVNLNGGGTSINFGPVSREFFCLNQAGAPADAPERSFRRQASTGSCNNNTGALGNATVAYRPGHPFVGCGDRVLIHNQGVKTVTDTCPGCTNTQLDNFTMDGACAGIADLGNFKTIKLLDP